MIKGKGMEKSKVPNTKNMNLKLGSLRYIGKYQLFQNPILKFTQLPLQLVNYTPISYDIKII